MCPGESFRRLTCLFLYFDCGKPLMGFLKLLSVPGNTEAASWQFDLSFGSPYSNLPLILV